MSGLGRASWRRVLAIVSILAGASATRPAHADTVAGVVRDGIGAAIANARISFRSGSVSVQTVTSADGTFTLDPGLAIAGRIRVIAEGFSPVDVEWKSGERKTVTLTRVPFATEVTVTASRVEEKLGDTPARVVVLGESAVRESPSTSIDDVLRQVPGFTLFRRTGSRGANPTSQGASLRGVGPSGASRTLVLVDGVPLNDPFGGWIYWSRVPRTAVERIEVLEGGASDLYGSAALGGVIQMVTRSEPSSINAELFGGEQKTAGGSLHASRTRGLWTGRFIGEAFTTGGWLITDPSRRGAVDTAAGSRHVTGILGVERRSATGNRAFLRTSGFGETRTNGTVLQDNDTERWGLTLGADWSRPSGALSIRAWHADQTYNQSFTAVAADRATETLTRRQHLPTRASGGSLVYSHSIGAKASIVSGVEGRFISGRSEEAVYVADRVSSFIDAGGDELTLAAFGHLRAAVGDRGVASFGLRLDHWANRDGETSSRPASGGPPSTTFYLDRSSTRLSPRASLLVRPASHVRVNVSAYGSFRGPTLNELYRSFRVGDTLTQANPRLEEESLMGVEGGISWSRSDERLRLRAVLFAAEVDDPVANVTQTATPTLITRERRNLGRTRSRGVSFEGEFNPGPSFQMSGGYTFVDAMVLEYAADPLIPGKQIPQVPRHHLTVEGRYARPRVMTLLLQARYTTELFEDDRNQLSLGSCFSLDSRISRPVSPTLEVFVAGENLTNRQCDAGLTPFPTIGSPRLLRVGVRFR